MFPHLLPFLLAATVIWFFTGPLIDAVDRVAQRFDRPGFTVAFFVLGLLTSISEISVAMNSTLTGVPEVSAGNLMGASVVIFLLIIPFLAVVGGGIPLLHSLPLPTLALLLVLVMLPSVLGLDGAFIRAEGWMMLLLYLFLLYVLQEKRPPQETAAEAILETEEQLFHVHRATWVDIGKIVTAAICIFLAGNVLVRESVDMATVLHIPPSYIGLLLLGLGTNVPELVIGVRAVLRGKHDIALGDYLGSAAANTLVFSLMVITNGSFSIDPQETFITFLVFSAGLSLFLIFSQRGRRLSQRQGLCLLAIYVLFIVFQLMNAVR